MTGHYLATFAPGTREPHPFTLRPAGQPETLDNRDDRAHRIASTWAGFSELFRKTDHGYERVQP